MDMHMHTTNDRSTKRTLSHLGPAAAILLPVGLIAAISTDGRLPGTTTQMLLCLLLILDVIAAEWLTRPRA